MTVKGFMKQSMWMACEVVVVLGEWEAFAKRTSLARNYHRAIETACDRCSIS
jgi:hypothetical protein